MKAFRLSTIRLVIKVESHEKPPGKHDRHDYGASPCTQRATDDPERRVENPDIKTRQAEPARDPYDDGYSQGHDSGKRLAVGLLVLLPIGQRRVLILSHVSILRYSTRPKRPISPERHYSHHQSTESKNFGPMISFRMFGLRRSPQRSVAWSMMSCRVKSRSRRCCRQAAAAKRLQQHPAGPDNALQAGPGNAHQAGSDNAHLAGPENA